MCTVSNIGDYGRSIWPTPQPYVYPIQPAPYNGPTKEQFEEFLELVRAAKKFDAATGQKDCPTEDKTNWMKDLAVHVGVDPAKVDEILKP